MTPDRRMVEKIQEYDKELYVTWNNKDHFFELWRKKIGGDKLITPVTQSIYDSKQNRVFCQLDERILWWLYEADSWRGDNTSWRVKNKEWIKWKAKLYGKEVGDFKDRAKDMWCAMNNKYVTKHKSVTLSSKGRYPKFNKHPEFTEKWSRPSIKGSGRTYRGSKINAKKIGYA